ncbi:MAG: tetratricopeptide repeat protein [Acidimicrobiia bacterium]
MTQLTSETRSGGNPRHNLPIRLTRFIGRDRELAELAELLGQTRLLTLTGAAGAGKSRLAIEAAARAMDAYPGGAWLADLSTLENAAALPEAVAGALGLAEREGGVGEAFFASGSRPVMATLNDFLADKAVLLILDGCEHVVTAAGELAGELFQGSPRLHLLVTSQQALGIPGELVWRVPPLGVPDEGDGRSASWQSLAAYDAVELFVDRAKVVRPDFALTERTAPAVVEICRRLDGMPLAIELAAARVKVLGADEIAARLGDRFRLLTDSSRPGQLRHGTLRAAVDWSYELLSQPERLLFNRLSVFRGGFTLEAAERVGAYGRVQPSGVLDLISQLVDKSMLVAAEDPSGSARYRLPETLRQYADDRLEESGEGEAAKRRHADFYLAYVEDAQDKVRGVDQALWLARLELEHDNFRAALRRSLDSGDTETALRLAGALYLFWFVHRHAEGRDWLERALSAAGEAPPDAMARALVGAGLLSALEGDLERGTSLLREGMGLYQELGDSRGDAEARLYLGIAARNLGDFERAVLSFEEALALYEGLGDAWGVAWCQWFLGSAARRRGDYARARSFIEQSLASFRELGDPFGIANCLALLGTLAGNRGDHERAVESHQESLSLFRQLEDRAGIASALSSLGLEARRRGDHAQAVELLGESLRLARDLKNRVGVARTSAHLGEVARQQGDYGRAASALGECLTESRELGGPVGDRWASRALESAARLAREMGYLERAVRLFGAAEAFGQSAGKASARQFEYDRDVVAARAALGEGRLSELWAEGRSMAIDQALAYTLEDAGRGDRLALDTIELGDRVARTLQEVGERREIRVAGIRMWGGRRRPSGERAPLPRELRASGRLWLLCGVVIALIWISLFAWPGTKRWWTQRDHEVLSWLVDRRTDALTSAMQGLQALGSEWLVRVLLLGTTIALVGFRRWRHLFGALSAFLLLAWIGQTLALEIARPRPQLEILGDWEGFAHPSLPVAALTITLVVMGYSLAPKGSWRTRWFVVSGVIIGALSIARLYLGVDHPSDVVTAAGFGVAIGVVVFRLLVPDAAFPVTYRKGRTAHLYVGGARGVAIRQGVKDQLGFDVLDVEPVALEVSAGSTPLRLKVAGEPEAHVFAKLYASAHLRSDRWYKLGRTILYGSLEDEVRFTSVRHLVEYEDYMLRVMRDAGVPSAQPHGIVEITPEREYLIVTEFLEGAEQIGTTDISDSVIDDALRIVRRMWAHGLAHRDLKPANVMVRDGRVLLIDLAFGAFRPTPWRQAVDLANMMLILGLGSDPERIYQRALRHFAPEDVAEAFAATHGVTIPAQLRAAVRDRVRQNGIDLVAEFRRLAPHREPIAIQRWSARRLGLTAATLGVVLVFFMLVIDNLRGTGFL